MIGFIAALFCTPVFAGEKKDGDSVLTQAAHGSLRDSVFSFDSSEDNPSESLNRIAGYIETGKIPKDQAVKSANHYRPGPFGREQAALAEKARKD